MNYKKKREAEEIKREVRPFFLLRFHYDRGYTIRLCCKSNGGFLEKAVSHSSFTVHLFGQVFQHVENLFGAGFGLVISLIWKK